VPIVLKSGSLNRLELLGLVQACNGIALALVVVVVVVVSIIIIQLIISLLTEQTKGQFQE
jgi:hypothetical protein